MKAIYRSVIAAFIILVLFCTIQVLLKSDSFLHGRNMELFGRQIPFAFGMLVTAGASAIIFTILFCYSRITAIHKRYFNIFENNPVPIAIVDDNSQRFLAVNKAAIECYGYSSAEFLKLKISHIRIEEETPLDAIYHDHIDGSLYKGTIRKHRKKSGDIIVTEVSATEVEFKNRKCRLLLARDITEIIQSKEEKRIAEEENQYQKKFTTYVLENFPVDVAVFDKAHRYILLNKTAVKNDETRQWLIGKDDFAYFERKGKGTAIATARRERFKKAISGERTEWIEEHIVNGELKYVLRKFYPYKENGELKYVYGYGMDITEVRKAQLQKDAHLHQLEKIAFDTSHRIRQPLCNIQGLIALLESGHFNSEEMKKIIVCMSESSKVLDDFTRELALKLDHFKQQLEDNNEQ